MTFSTQSYNMLLRKGVAVSSIFAVALLVAITASTNAIVNYLNLQSENLAGARKPAWNLPDFKLGLHSQY
jgi:hypothetical protein